MVEWKIPRSENVRWWGVDGRLVSQDGSGNGGSGKEMEMEDFEVKQWWNGRLLGQRMFGGVELMEDLYVRMGQGTVIDRDHEVETVESGNFKVLSKSLLQFPLVSL